MFCNGYNVLVTNLVNRTADSLGVSLSNELVDKLIREATEIVVMDWCEYDYDKDAEWLELNAEVDADSWGASKSCAGSWGVTVGQDMVEAIESQMNFMGTLGAVLKVARKEA